MKKWVLLFALLPLSAFANPEDAAPMKSGIYADAQYKLEDRFCLDGSDPTDAGFQKPDNVGLVFSEKGKLTIQVQIDMDNSVDVNYRVYGTRIVVGNPQGGANQVMGFRVQNRNLTLVNRGDEGCKGHGGSISQFYTNGQNVNYQYSNSLNTGFPYDLNWAIDSNNPEGYTVKYVGFKTETPNIVAIDQVELKAKSGADMISKLAERANRCIEVTIDDAAKTVTVKPRALIFVDSKHIENSTYSVEGKPPFTLETNNEQRERYFCIIRPDLIEAEWQKKAFADYLKGPYIPSIIHR